MREVYRDIVYGLTLIVASFTAYLAWRGPHPADPPAVQSVANHPLGGLIVVAVLFLLAGILNSMPLLLRFFPTKPKSSDVEGYASSLLNNQAHEFAKGRLEQLADDAIMLVRLAPTTKANQTTAAHLWLHFVSKWRDDVIHNLQTYWDNKAVEYFASADGFNKHEAVGDVLEVAAPAYRELLHSQKTLKELRRTL